MLTEWPQLKVRSSQRARRLSLQVKTDFIELVLPDGVSINDAETFVRQNQRWLQKQLKRLSQQPPVLREWPPNKLELAALDQYWGCQLSDPEPSYYLNMTCDNEPDQRICLGCTLDDGLLKRYLLEWLKQRAYGTFKPWMDRLAVQHGLSYESLQIRNQQTRWGSCNNAGLITLNLKLLFFRPEVAQYVMVHELCHTVHANHSQRFWRLVEQCEPYYRQACVYLNDEKHVVPRWVYG